MNRGRRLVRAYGDSFRGLPRDVWFLCGTMLINRAGAMVMIFQTLYLTESRGLSKVAVSWVVTAYALGSAVGALLGGQIVDRIGAFRTQLASTVASGLWLLVFPYAMHDAGPLGFAIAFFALSLVADAARPAMMAGIADRAPPECQARAFTLLRLAMSVGLAIAPAAGGYLADAGGYRWLFLINGAASLAAAAWLVVAVGPDPTPPPDTRERASRPPPRSPWRDGPFLVLIALVVVVASAFFQILVALPVYMREIYGFDRHVIGNLLAFNSILILAFEMPLIRWTERRDLLRWFGFGSLLVCVGFGLMPLGTGVLYAAFTIVVWTIGEMLCLPLSNALVAARAPRGSRGAYMGLYAMAFSIAFVITPIWSFRVYEYVSPHAVWYAVAALGPLVLAGAWALRARWTATSEAPAADRQPTDGSAG